MNFTQFHISNPPSFPFLLLIVRFEFQAEEKKEREIDPWWLDPLESCAKVDKCLLSWKTQVEAARRCCRAGGAHLLPFGRISRREISFQILSFLFE